MNNNNSGKFTQQFPESSFSTNNEDSQSGQSESLENINNSKSLKEKIIDRIQEKKKSISENPEEEKKNKDLDDLDLIMEKLPIFCNIENDKPKDHPNQKIINFYLNSEFSKNPKTISRFWLPIESLKNEGMFNKNFKNNVNILKSNFAAWRKVRGDGNCYYRSVMSSYLLKIFHPSTDIIHLEKFMEKLLKNKGYYQPLENIYNTLSQLYFEFRDFCKSSVYLKIENLLQDTQFDLDLIETSRFLSEFAIENCSEIKEFLVGDNEESQLKINLRKMGNEAEGLELYLLPTALGITVEQINFFDKILYSIFPNQDPLKFVVHIISKSRGHYDMLLSVRDIEIQQYSVNELIYYHN